LPAAPRAPVTADDLLVGMIRGGFDPGGPLPAGAFPFPLRARPEIVSINAILADVNAKGGPGAGFTPVGA
jgi:hypothetical protein